MLEHWKTRFLEHMERHPGLSWETAEQRLSGDPQALETLRRMEASGGEPDTLGWTDDGRLLFCDCSRGGALFCERRYGRVFTFHNGADSYYAVRGWRGYLII